MHAPPDPLAMDWTLVGRYLGGELAPAERRAFERWIAARPERREEMIVLRHLWDDAAGIPSAAAMERMWRSVAQRMAADQHATTVTGDVGPTHARTTASRVSALPSLSPPNVWKVPAIVAAAAVLIIALAFADRRLGRGHAVAPAPPAREFRTSRGQRATIQLTDGSRVELGVASVLTVPLFTDGTRTVTLEGEAIFDVVHDAQRPFRVQSAGTITEDLGTRFGVRAYAEDAAVRVFVTSGTVNVHRPATQTPSRVLRAGELARVDAHGAVTVQTNIDTTRYLAWTHSRVILRNQSLHDAVIEIGRWHEATITIPDARVARMKVTVDMPLGTLKETLNAVTIPLGLRYELTRDGAVIRR